MGTCICYITATESGPAYVFRLSESESSKIQLSRQHWLRFTLHAVTQQCTFPQVRFVWQWKQLPKNISCKIHVLHLAVIYHIPTHNEEHHSHSVPIHKWCSSGRNISPTHKHTYTNTHQSHTHNTPTPNMHAHSQRAHIDTMHITHSYSYTTRTHTTTHTYTLLTHTEILYY